jgi:hypothetical protein
VVPQPSAGAGQYVKTLEAVGEIMKSGSIMKLSHAYAPSPGLGHMTIYGLPPPYGKDVLKMCP